MTLQDLLDRQEIHDLLVRYCHGIDRHEWARVEAVFTPDATLDYTAFGGPRGSVGEVVPFLRTAVTNLSGCQHTISTSLVDIDGNTATARTAAQVMMMLMKDTPTLFGLWYRDQLIKTSQGWRIRERVQEFGWIHNAPSTPAS